MIGRFADEIFRIKPRTGGFFPLRIFRKSQTKGKTGVGGRVEEKTRVTLHPAFFLAGVFYSLTGDLPVFLMTAIIALEHELAHAFAAARLGYRLNKILLMPYGAVIDGDLTGLSLKDEIAVAIAGPLCNFLTAAGFAALWWFYPETYAYTDSACFLSLSIALVNLLPAYPLDGGRALKCALTLLFLGGERQGNAERRAELVCKVISVVIALLLTLAFFILAKGGTFNYTIPGFAFFIFVGAFGSKEDARYQKLNFSNLPALSHGVEVRRVAVLSSAPLKSVFRYLCRGKYLVLEVYDECERLLGEVKQSELSKFFVSASVYAPIGEVLVEKGSR